MTTKDSKKIQKTQKRQTDGLTTPARLIDSHPAGVENTP